MHYIYTLHRKYKKTPQLHDIMQQFTLNTLHRFNQIIREGSFSISPVMISMRGEGICTVIKHKLLLQFAAAQYIGIEVIEGKTSKQTLNSAPIISHLMVEKLMSLPTINYDEQAYFLIQN